MKPRSLIFLFFCTLLAGCIENDSLQPNLTKEFETNALILKELENRDVFLNTKEFPALIDADTLFKYINDYNIIDVRNAESFQKGHIPNSVNINNSELFDYVVNLNPSKPIVIVSITGQASAFYNALFRVYGLKNTFSLKFGIAGWNKKFENEILKWVGDNQINCWGHHFDKISHFKLPTINDEKNIKELYDQRIRDLFQNGFNETFLEENSDYSMDNSVAISFNSLNLIYDGNDIAILAVAATDIFQDIQKPMYTQIYHPFKGINEFFSTENLQTIPSDKYVACYSYSGQISAATVAMLRVLGYKAISILFGVQNYSNTIILNTLGTGRLYVFRESNDFPIVVP